MSAVATTTSKALIPEVDADFLSEKGYSFDVQPENGAVWVIIRDFPFPAPYTPNQAELLVQLPAGYPNAKPDMFWTSPDIKLSSGAWPKSSDVHETHCGRTCQRWSRHFPDDRWRPGTDNMRSYLASIRAELAQGL